MLTHPFFSSTVFGRVIWWALHPDKIYKNYELIINSTAFSPISPIHDSPNRGM